MSPPSGPAPRLVQGPPAKSKLLAAFGDQKGAAEVRIKGKRHDRSAEMVFAAGSPRGNWMERVRKAGAGDFPKLMVEMEAVIEVGGGV